MKKYRYNGILDFKVNKDNLKIVDPFPKDCLQGKEVAIHDDTNCDEFSVRNHMYYLGYLYQNNVYVGFMSYAGHPISVVVPISKLTKFQRRSMNEN